MKCRIHEIDNCKQCDLDSDILRDALKLSSKDVLSMPHGWWSVEVSTLEGVIVTIEPEILAGKSELTENDLSIIRTAAYHLLSFLGD